MRKSGNRESSVRFLSRGHAKFPMVAARWRRGSNTEGAEQFVLVLKVKCPLCSMSPESYTLKDHCIF